MTDSSLDVNEEPPMCQIHKIPMIYSAQSSSWVCPKCIQEDAEADSEWAADSNFGM